MFRQLRVKLTVLYGALFCVALLIIGATAYAVVASNTQRGVRDQLASAGAVFDRMSELRLQQLRAGAQRSADDLGFRQAVASRDGATIGAALSALKTSVGADAVFVVTAEGLMIGEDGAGNASVSPGLQVALGREAAPSGIIMHAGELHLAATTPIYAPNLVGWVIVGEEIDQPEMRGLERLSAIPLQASPLAHDSEGWGGGADRAALTAFVDQSLQSTQARPGLLDAPSGRAIALVKPLRSLDGTRSALLLRYPLSSALSPYRTLFNTLILIGLAGLGLIVFGTWLLAGDITKPLHTLEEAARRLTQGVYEPVVVRTKDELSRLAESFNAMTGAIREREQKITHLAYHDAETRLPNRLALERRLAATQPKRLFLAAIGIDRFAHIRGAIGYAHASGIIRRLGARLARLVPNAPMARLSSEALGVAFLADDEADARKRCLALIANLEQSISLDGQVVDVNISIGVAWPRAEKETPAEMIERASIALDQAHASRVNVALFDEAAYGDPARNLSLMGEMRKGLSNGDIFLAHQAKYNFRTNSIDSVEALVRWKHPTRGMIAPDLFVPMAEETGQVRALTEWVLTNAIAEQKKLAEAGFPLAVSINISGRLLADPDFMERALRAVKSTPHQLCFEITETAVIEDPKQALRNIEVLAANGVRVSIDDYGSGLSSLGYLKQLPAHELKIDKVFIQSLTNSQRDALLVRSTIDLAHGLGMKVTAEGVENPAAFSLLAAMGCDMAQGYLIARPAPLADLITLLNDDKRLEYYRKALRTAS
ncbi:putative bifunctional diguanylate cyclase/phosphodiesterase [Terricaulis sp.]|uniref:putative bifunctional diguanylate cyclase/phosphodiesterase n=1 Tax=Terricaulis sp. TaxID=2768686 RepID=UPI003783FD54